MASSSRFYCILRKNLPAINTKDDEIADILLRVAIESNDSSLSIFHAFTEETAPNIILAPAIAAILVLVPSVSTIHANLLK